MGPAVQDSEIMFRDYLSRRPGVLALDFAGAFVPAAASGFVHVSRVEGNLVAWSWVSSAFPALRLPRACWTWLPPAFSQATPRAVSTRRGERPGFRARVQGTLGAGIRD